MYLETGVAAGDIVTVSYTKPATNPLQSEYGIPAASMSDQPVTNNILPAGDPPVYLSSIIPTYPTIMVMNYSLTLANIVPATSSFTVKVNSVARNIQSVRIYGPTVWVYLETGVATGDIVTVAYTRACHKSFAVRRWYCSSIADTAACNKQSYTSQISQGSGCKST